MQLRDAIRRRRMVRNYDPDRLVSRAQLDGLLELAIRAPSAGFSQGWHFLVLDAPDAIARFWDVTSEGAADSWRMGMSRAPALVVTLSNKSIYLDRYAEPDKGWTDRDEGHWPVPYWHIDTGMAAMIALLGAQEAGLGACFFGVPGERWPQLRAAFDVPQRLSPIGVISLGYPAADRRSPSLRRGRRSIEDVVHYGSF
jgi:nitroreductase